MMFDALRNVRNRLHAVLLTVPVGSENATALIEAIDELDDAMVMDVRAQTYAADLRADRALFEGRR